MAERVDGSMSISRFGATASRALSRRCLMSPSGGWHHRSGNSSPGIDRPLVRRSDVERSLGQVVKIEMAVPVEGRSDFRGAITAVKDETCGFRMKAAPRFSRNTRNRGSRTVLTNELLLWPCADRNKARETAPASKSRRHPGALEIVKRPRNHQSAANHLPPLKRTDDGSQRQ